MNWTDFKGNRRLLAVAVVAILAALVLAGAYFAFRPAEKPELRSQQQAQALVAAGIRYQSTGQTVQALADYNSAINLDPNNKYAYYNRGLIYQGQAKNVEAEKDYRKALSIDPNFENALYNLAVIRTPISSTEGEALYRKVIALDSHNAEAHLNLGFILLGRGDKAGATAEFNVAVVLKPALASRIPS